MFEWIHQLRTTAYDLSSTLQIKHLKLFLVPIRSERHLNASLSAEARFFSFALKNFEVP